MSREFSEEELRALEAEMERLTVDDVLLQTLVTLINLGARKAGLAAPPGEEAPARDLAQTRQAIDGARAILPLVESRHAEQLGPVRDALSRLQMAFVQLSGGPEAVPDAPEAAPGGPGEAPQGAPGPGAAPGGAPAGPGAAGRPGGPEESQGPGPAQRSGRLWVPGS
jgi:hypothetical protein